MPEDYFQQRLVTLSEQKARVRNWELFIEVHEGELTPQQQAEATARLNAARESVADSEKTLWDPAPGAKRYTMTIDPPSCAS